VAEIEFTMSLIPSPLTEPVLSGKVPVAGSRITMNEASSVNTNSLQMLDRKYDVGEMSMATLTRARQDGIPLVALPIFTGRRFLHSAVTLAPNVEVKDLSELRGKRVGLPQFWMTSSVWHRLILHLEYGVAQDEVQWVTMAPERLGTLQLPPGARQDTSGRTVQELLAAGEIDASMGAGVEREQAGAGAGGAAPKRAFADPVAAQRDYYARTKVFPIMHLIVMNEELAKQHPELVSSLATAFTQAKSGNLATALGTRGFRPIPGLEENETTSLFGADPWRYGIEANRRVLETFLGDAQDQGLTDQPMAPEDLFPRPLPSQLA
jgi:4,5-dihydroxyphthalate decarboxylase